MHIGKQDSGEIYFPPSALKDSDSRYYVSHTKFLVDGGYLERNGRTELGPYRLTSQGYDFLAVLENENVWEKIKAYLDKVDNLPLNSFYNLSKKIFEEIHEF